MANRSPVRPYQLSLSLLLLSQCGGMLKWSSTGNSVVPSPAVQQIQVLQNVSRQTEACDPDILYRGPQGLPPQKVRKGLAYLLEARKLTDGAEVGVQRGVHARQLLSKWKSCKSLKLIDLWGQQENYKDLANVNNGEQELYYQDTVRRLDEYKGRTELEFMRMLSAEAATKISDASLDFIYIDARHDYCGVSEDLEAFYPKLRPGGIMAGHDFMDAEAVKSHTPKQDWSVCSDGTVNKGAVEGAVVNFAEKYGLVVSVMYDEGGAFPSWVVQKPTRLECVKEMGSFGSSN